MSALNEQEGGDHYKKMGEHQPWIVAKKWLTPEELKGAAKMTAIVYLCRENDKGGRQDIIKAMHTLQIYLEITEPVPHPSGTYPMSDELPQPTVKCGNCGYLNYENTRCYRCNSML